MTLRHMKIFVAVCKYNSITKAAQSLYLAQPAVSCAIRDMEEYYGVMLFDRISKKLYLTEEGKKMLEYSLHIVGLFDEMENEIKNIDNIGKIRVGASMTVGEKYMPQLIRLFIDKYPHIEVTVCVNRSDLIEDKLYGNELDFGIIEGIVHSDKLISKEITTDEMVVICSPQNPILNEGIVTPERIMKEKFLLRDEKSAARELVNSALELYGFSIKPIWESSITQPLVNAVIQNLGISILPFALVKEYIDDKKICFVPVEGLDLKRKYNLIYHKNKYLTQTALDFIEMSKEVILKK